MPPLKKKRGREQNLKSTGEVSTTEQDISGQTTKNSSIQGFSKQYSQLFIQLIKT